MDYYLYKLKFDGAVHFGQSESALSLYTTADHFRADTLFSALCHTALSLWGEDGVQALVKQTEADELLLSDSMPWRELAHEDVFYLPKPCAVSEKKWEISAELRKKMKRLLWIPVSDMGRFEQSIRGDALYKPKDEYHRRCSHGSAGGTDGSADFGARHERHRRQDQFGVWLVYGGRTNRFVRAV